MVCSVAYIIRPLSIPPPVELSSSSSTAAAAAVESLEQQQPMGDYFLDKAYVTIIHNELEVLDFQNECLQLSFDTNTFYKKDRSRQSSHVFAV